MLLEVPVNYLEGRSIGDHWAGRAREMREPMVVKRRTRAKPQPMRLAGEVEHLKRHHKHL